MNNSKICFIFGALKTEKLAISPTGGDLVIAADMGLKRTQAHGIIPDIVIGDFDSLGQIPAGDNIIRLPVRKDDTDVGYAVKHARDMGFNRFVMYGVLGGSLDHTVANLQIASGIAENGGTALLLGDDGCAAVISDRKLSFDFGKGRLSVLSLSDCSNISIKGAEYEVKDAPLTRNFPLGVSNGFKDNSPASITVHSGTVAVLWENAAVPEIL